MYISYLSHKSIVLWNLLIFGPYFTIPPSLLIMANFRIDARHFFLTYANVEGQGWIEFTKDDLCRHLKEIQGVEYVITCRELHQDGSTHFHAYLRFQRKKCLRNAAFYDYNGVHPNIQAARNPMASINYVKKDNEWMELGDEPEEYNLVGICNESTRIEWLQYCITKKIGYQYMEEIWKLVHVPRTSTIMPDDVIVGDMCPRLQEFRYEGPLSVVLVGAAGCGKSTWAKQMMPKPALFVSHLDRLKDFDPAFHRSIIFDDMNFVHLPRETQIAIVDRENHRDIHRRYGITNIPAGLPKCFTANYRPFMEDPALNRRIRLINLVTI